MEVSDQDPAGRIKALLAENRRGLTISEIAARLDINRNRVSTLLSLLEVTGDVEYTTFGKARAYYPARRIPAAALLSLSSDLVCTFDESGTLLFGNETFLSFFGLRLVDVRGRKVDDIPTTIRDIPLLSTLLSDLLTGRETVCELTVLQGTVGSRTVHFRGKGIPTIFEDGGRGTTVILEDLTAEREYTRNLEFLARTSAQLADMGDDENIYQYIADRIAELAPESMVGISSVHPRTHAVTLAAVGGDRALLEGLFSGLGIAPDGAAFTMENTPEAAPFLTKSHLEEAADRLYIQLFRMFPEELCDRLQDQLSLGKNYGMGCVCRGGLYGSVTIRLKKGAELRHRETIEAFVRQAGIALQRRHMREKLQLAEERIYKLESSGDIRKDDAIRHA
jgi:PAS domain S-box-containing protein